MTDLELEQRVQGQLKRCAPLRVAEIGVVARNGVVTLTGEVGSYCHKSLARDAVADLPGVLAIVDHLLHRGEEEQVTDQAIAERTLAALVSHNAPPSARVLVEHGWITLRGSPNDLQQCVGLDAAVRASPGVKGVSYEQDPVPNAPHALTSQPESTTPATSPAHQ